MECSDCIPEKYEYLFEEYEQPDFEPEVVCAVDVADTRLLGDKLSVYADRVELCIDHHGSNTGYARYRLLDAESAATAELILALLREWEMRPDRMIAECLYTGIATDTGCFKYSNTTSGDPPRGGGIDGCRDPRRADQPDHVRCQIPAPGGAGAAGAGQHALLF